MKKIKIEFGSEGQKIVGVMYKPNGRRGRAVIMCHGFTGRKRNPRDKKLVKAAETFCKNGFAVLMFDFRGSGKSEGDFADVTVRSEVSDLKAAIGFMRNKGYGKTGLLGFSLGGAVCIVGQCNHVKAMALWSPVTNLKGTFLESFLANKNVRKSNEGAFVVFRDGKREFKIGKGFWKDVETMDIRKYLKRTACPTLILHGNKDRVVPLRHSGYAVKTMKNAIKKLEVIKGAGHDFSRPRDEKRIIESSLSWFERWLE